MINTLNTAGGATITNIPHTALQGGRAHGAINDVEENTSTRSVRLQRFPAKRRMGSLLLYIMAALALAVLCAFTFNALGQDTEFAIAVMGSLIGGFLGAMLAAALIVDIRLSK